MALEWRPVTGYEGLYLVSNDGQVLSLPRVVDTGYRKQHRKAKLLKTGLRGRDGLKYKFVILSDGQTTSHISIHRLVAQSFLNNPAHYEHINHKDHNTLNNCVDNLEWCSQKYNNEYSHNKPIAQYSSIGELIRRFSSATHASEETGIDRRNICNALNGWAKKAGGFIWKYQEG